MNVPGSLATSAALTVSCQTVLAILGLFSAATGAPPMSLVPATTTRCTSSGELFLRMRSCAADSLLMGELGVLANLMTPTYSE